MSPKYVDFGGLATAPGPLQCRGVTMYGFWVAGDRQRLRDLCCRVFAVPSKGRVVVKPLPAVLITFVRIDEIVSEHKDFRHIGRVGEREVVVWVPTFVFRSPRAVPAQRRASFLRLENPLAAFIPYIWLDNSISIASGREVYGYPKVWGRLASEPAEALDARPMPPLDPGPPDPPDCLRLDAFGVRRYGADELVRPLELLRLSAQGGAAGGPREGLQGLLLESWRRIPAFPTAVPGGELELLADDAGEDESFPRWRAMSPREARRGERRGSVVRRSPLDRVLARLLEQLTINQIFLKQTRSAAEGSDASLQEIVRAPAHGIDDFHWRSLPDYRLEVQRLDSHPLHELLAGDQARSDPLVPNVHFAFSAHFDFRVEPGEVLWRGH